MTSTLSTVRDLVEITLADPINLIWSTEALDQAIRAALAEISQVYGCALTLNGLDSATATTIEAGDIQVLALGASATALAIRLTDRLEEACPVREDIDELVKNKDKAMAKFQAMLAQIRLRKLQESDNAPYAPWAWEEGESFG